MAPGEYNGKNYGGMHTGTGKYQKGGVYSANGERHRTIPNREFSAGKEVSYVGTHKDFIRTAGKILQKKRSSQYGRSFIHVELKDGRKTYFHKDVLSLVK